MSVGNVFIVSLLFSLWAPSTVHAQSLVQKLELPLTRLVSPYSMDSGLQNKREEIIQVIVGAAVNELSRTCETQNLKLSKQAVPACSRNACPDLQTVIIKESRTLTIQAFIETQLSFEDVKLGFLISWDSTSEQGSLSVCYAPALHPSTRELEQSLRYDPFFLNRVAHAKTRESDLPNR